MDGGHDLYGLYIHIPFCRAKCSYCDFCSFPGMEDLYARYVEALACEMGLAGAPAVKTIYFGGGTPSVLPPPLLARLVEAARTAFDTSAVREMTIEANPGTVGAALLSDLVRMGFSRLSLGVQSLNAGELALLGRVHTADQAVEAAAAARAAGFEQINLDLIYGLPGQTAAAWLESLERALELGPDHLSLYALTLEEGTPLAAQVRSGAVPEPDPDQAADMYEAAEQMLDAEGFVHYEISNWAVSEAAECQHNLVYWRNEPYLGLGAGAHSWTGGRRRANLASPAEYAARMAAGMPAVEEAEQISPEMEMGETMMLGLRLLQEGVEYARFQERFGAGLRERYGAEIDELVERGLLEVGPRGIVLSERGRLLGNQVFMRFLAD